MPRNHKKITRIFVENALQDGVEIELDKSQSNHLLNVLRKKTGDGLIVFNGVDGAWLGKITQADRKKSVVKLLEQIAVQPKNIDLWYGFAPLKKARLDYMIQKATEMGVSNIAPVITQHTQAQKLKTERLKAYVVEAAQQCEVLNIPKIEAQTTFKKLLENWYVEHGERVLIVGDESKEAGSPLATLEALRGKKIGLLIGPEGGFSDEELAFLYTQDFVIPISLGERILRADTAAVAALALIQAIIYQ